MAASPWHDRLYRALLTLFPREFRGDFGDQMADDFRDQRADAARKGAAAPVMRLWGRTLLDALQRAPREHLDILRRDAGYALRLFRRRPGMTASAVLTLAIGIGLTSAVFSVAYGVLWRSLPLPNSERLVSITELGPPPERDVVQVSSASFNAWERETRTLDSVASVSVLSATLVGDGGAEQVYGATVSRRFFGMLGARPALGRLLDDGDFKPLMRQRASQDSEDSAAAAVPTVGVIGHALWQRQFGGRADIIGSTVMLGRAGAVEVVGVLTRDFVFPQFRNAEYWLPDVPDNNPYAGYWTVIGRLAPGVTVRAAQAEFDVIASRLAAADPARGARGVRVMSLRERITAGVQTQLWFLFATALCVLLIAAATVSNLLLAHTSGRQRELVTRVALGATRAHLVRQALTEGLVLAAIGGLAGFFLAWWAVPSLIALAPPTIPRLSQVNVNWHVLAFAGAASICVGVICGLAASLTSSRSVSALWLRNARGRGGYHGGRCRRSLIIAQIALALMLAVAAGLLVQTMRAVTALPLGFDPSRVISIGFSADMRGQEGTTAKARLETALVEGIRTLDGVVAAGIGSRPLNPGGMGTAIALPSSPSEHISITVDPVGPGYLEALGAQLVAGRFFDDRDGPGAPLVALVNEAAATRHWPAGPVGEVIVQYKRPVLIVGVLNDVRRKELEAEPEPTLYVPSAQTANFWTNNMLVRTSGDPRELLPAIRTVVRRVDPTLPLTRIETLSERLDATLAPRRFTLWLVGLFSIIALVLAVIGIYGVVMESVAHRVPEIGVRMALGATAAGVMRMVLRQGAWMIGIGVALGTAAALAMNGMMTAFVFGVPTTDPLAFSAACAAMIAAGLLACAIPARRAALIDPVLALRQE